MKNATKSTPLDAQAAARVAFVAQLRSSPPHEAALLLGLEPPARALELLSEFNPAQVQDILDALDVEPRARIIAAAPAELAEQWSRNNRYERGTIGRLMEPALAVFGPNTSVGDAIDGLRPIVRSAFITYGYVIDQDGGLVGLFTMRDLLFSDRLTPLAEVMLRDPFTLLADLPLSDAMKRTLNRHFPVYPVTDINGKLLGLVRGSTLFQEEAFEITAQPGAMVGVDAEERIATPLFQSFKFRNPWLLINLVTAFAAGGVVALFQGTVDKLVILATFLPVLAGQSGNTGCQALAVTVRGITLGDIRPGGAKLLVIKEALLGLANGAVTGVLTGIAMYFLATSQNSPDAVLLGVAVCVAMVASCAVSGISGALVPLTLKRLGADPATASSIVVTTATDVASMGLLLGLATLLIR
ncbi:magnesium transporter [Usitatibacter palustris]|uniref:Magnesium transporter MgtE n=1 Tax=Usitatibacter palustris TaxID=2732487 RepID=A0A6M4H9K3_9PROT|nr:magnesium transporter [Usitatibacter palustris]QJR16270.1 Magnesium transporter MgtE [Usitatibacter palustris]